LDCVIEGVETAEELAVIRALGGVMVQGYLYARPMPIPDIGTWLAGTPAAERAQSANAPHADLPAAAAATTARAAS
jgi:predicted signal transduction protein with EAL and GGDEF domain